MSENFNLDQGSINAILYEKTLKPFVRSRIVEKHFKSQETRLAYVWITKFAERYSKIPSRKLFREQFPNFPIGNPGEPGEFFADAVVKRNTRKLFIEVMAEAGEAAQDGKIKEAISKMTAGVERIHLHANRSTDLLLHNDFFDLVQRYLKRKRMKKISGIPFGFPVLDENTDGAQMGHLSLIFGDQGIGKSWLALIFACVALIAGYRVLYVAKENLDEEIAGRMAALIAHVSPFRLRKGRLSPREERRLSRFGNRIQHLGENFIISAQDEVDGIGMGTAGIREKIMQYRPDLVIVDGLYLLEDEDLAKGPEHQTLRKLAYRLKRLARKEGVHITAVTQSNSDGASASSGASSASHIAYARGIGAACDMILNIYNNEDLKALNLMGIKLLKQREGPLVNFITSWDFERCVFSVVENDSVRDEPEPELPG
jgi:replicative DNA helicase